MFHLWTYHNLLDLFSFVKYIHCFKFLVIINRALKTLLVHHVYIHFWLFSYEKSLVLDLLSQNISVEYFLIYGWARKTNLFLISGLFIITYTVRAKRKPDGDPKVFLIFQFSFFWFPAGFCYAFFPPTIYIFAPHVEVNAGNIFYLDFSKAHFWDPWR